MKKVRLFAVAAAMGMFASTVAAAEPVVSTSYNATWGEVDEIVKVDVGDKVVAPTTTIKVVKETRTTDADEKVYVDGLGFDANETCDADENGDGYTDSQVYFNVDADDSANAVFYSSKLAAVEEYLIDNHLVLAPGAEEIEEGTYYSEYLNQYFADLEEVYAFLEEKGLVVSVYDEDGDLTKVQINPTTVTDKKGNVLVEACIEFNALTGRKAEEETKKTVAAALINGRTVGWYKAKYSYNVEGQKTYELPFTGVWGANTQPQQINPGSVVIVDEYKGEYNIIDVYQGGAEGAKATADAKYQHAGWTGSTATVTGTDGKVTVYVADKNDEVTKLATVAPTKVGRYTLESTMAWDSETGLFVKEEADYGEFDTVVDGYWYGNEYAPETDDEPEVSAKPYNTGALEIRDSAFGIKGINAVEENPTDKYLLKIALVNGVNTKEGKVTLPYAGGKDVVVDYLEVDDVNYAAFNDMETLVKVASKLDEFDGIVGVKWGNDTVSTIENDTYYAAWYNEIKALNSNPWSGYTTEVLPKSELRGVGSEACTYVIESKSEEVAATITSDADSVDTSVAGVKTLTLTAKVGEEVVSTKEVKVVVAPKYERTYVNGKVAVLKAFHLNGNLYAEYHYNWTAKTYEATFYAQDGVTVASTANGTL